MEDFPCLPVMCVYVYRYVVLYILYKHIVSLSHAAWYGGLTTVYTHAPMYLCTVTVASAKLAGFENQCGVSVIVSDYVLIYQYISDINDLLIYQCC